MDGSHALLSALRDAAARMAVAEARALRAHGVTAAEAQLIEALHAAGAVAPSALAARMRLTRGAVTRLVDRLRAKQLLVRARSGGGDRRMQTIALTGTGARLAPELARARAGAAERLLAGVPTSERARLAALLGGIAAARV